MSRIGNKKIVIPDGVTVEINKDNLVKVTGPKGNIESKLNPLIKIEIKDNKEITLTRPNNLKQTIQVHGSTRSLLDNMINGVTNQFQKELEIVGVGYRAQVSGNKLDLGLGFSHPTLIPIPEGITVECPKNTQIIIKGCNKQQVGQFAAEIRDLKRPEPYKGKGIRYVDEVVRRKAGKTAQ